MLSPSEPLDPPAATPASVCRPVVLVRSATRTTTADHHRRAALMPRALFWHKVPLTLATCAATDRLRHALRQPLSEAYGVRLWAWCWANNRARRFQGDTAASTLSAQAGWKGAPMRFMGALVSSGFATVSGAEVVLHDLVSVTLKDTKDLPIVSLSGAVSAPKRERKGSGKGAVAEPKVPQNAPETPVIAHARTGESPESRVQSPESLAQNQVPSPAAGAVGVLFVGDADSRATRKQKPALVPTGDVAIVWNAYAAHHPTSRFTSDRLKQITKALGFGYPPADLVRTIDGYAKSPYHAGDNGTGTKYLDLELFLRSAKHIEAGWAHLTATRPVGSGTINLAGQDHSQIGRVKV